MKNLYYTFSLLLFGLFIGNTAWSQTTTFEYTGEVQTYLIPDGVTLLQIEVFGAQGGGEFGGMGGRSIATLPVNPGTLLEVYVGGQPTQQLDTIDFNSGGFNGGGSLQALPCGGGSDGWPGGGASDVRTSSSLDDRLIVAGGGGGQGWSSGVGGSGGLVGTDGEASWIDDTHGYGGTQTEGGVGGEYLGVLAWDGVFGVGGNGGPIDTYCIGGGGGGGYYGGGGGYVSAGGGGSSYVGFPGTTDAITESGIRTGNGQINITLLCEPVTLSYTSTNEMTGNDGSIDITVTGGDDVFTFDWDNDGTGDFDDPEDLSNLTAGTYIVVVSGEPGCFATDTIEISSQVGIEELFESKPTVFPNPTNKDITLQYSGNFDYKVVNTIGEILYEGSAINEKNIVMKELSSGVYFVKITVNQKTTSIKVLKQ